MLKKLFARLFDGNTQAAADPSEKVEYAGYQILPQPLREADAWRVAGTISRECDGRQQVYRLIRADTMPDREQAVATTIAKARLVIDQQGDRMFDGSD